MAEKALQKARLAKKASFGLAVAPARRRNDALKKIISLLEINKEKILKANQKDVAAAKRAGISGALLKRLELTDPKFLEILRGVEGVRAQEDELGKTVPQMILDDGLLLSRVTTPLGVICAIFEARPDALVQISTLAIRTGNSALLKGGSEALGTDRELVKIIREALMGAGLPQDAIELIESRESVKALISMNEFVDLIIPRGSASFVKYIQENSTIPVLGHSDGICHEYVDEFADIEKAVRICYDAKCQYPAVCNAMETMLVNGKIAEKFLPKMAQKYARDVELRCDERSGAILKKNGFSVKKATEKDWATEYNDLILSIKIVKDVEEAIAHINKYGSKHTDGIITENKENAERFLSAVDASSVVWNASTRFADGYRYGKGAEIGVSTGKIHARGPSGAEALLSYKYVLKGNGHIVADYSGPNAKKFLHRKMH